MSLPTVTDLKIHDNQTSSTDDNELQDHLDAAIEVVEGIVGPISSGTVTETHYNVSSDVLVLKRMPVASLVSVSSRVGATTTALTLADYELDADTGLLRAVSGAGFYGSYTVSYTVGRSALPASIKLAVLIVAEHLWRTQRGVAPSPLDVQNQEFEQASPSGVGFAVPRRAAELLAAYVQPTVA